MSRLPLTLILLLITLLGTFSAETPIRIPILSPITETTPPGVRALLENSGLNQIIVDALPQATQQILATPFPDQNITQKIGIVGNVQISLTNIHIASLDIQSVVATFQQPNVISVATQGVTLQLKLDFSFKQESWPHTGGSGDIQADCTGASLSVAISTSASPSDAGKPHFNADTVTASLGQMKIHIHGGGSVGWLLSALESLFQTQIKNTIETQIKQGIIDTVNVQLNQEIQKQSFVIPVPIEPLDTSIDIDLSMTAPPAVVQGIATALNVESKAATYITGHHVEPPFKPVPVPKDVASTDNDFALYVTQWIFNDATWQLYNAGKLKYRLTNDKVPAESPIHLNTTDLKTYLPELYAKYPNQLVVIDMVAGTAPEISFGSVLTTALNVTLTFSVVDAQGNVQPAFVAGTYLAGSVSGFTVKASTTGQALNISATLEPFKISIQLQKSFIGDVDVGRIQNTINVLLNYGIREYINQKLQGGYELKLPDGLKVSNVVFKFDYGYLALGGKVAYAPPHGSALYNFKRRVFMTHTEREILARYACDEGLNHRQLECQPLWDLYYGK